MTKDLLMKLHNDLSGLEFFLLMMVRAGKEMDSSLVPIRETQALIESWVRTLDTDTDTGV